MVCDSPKVGGWKSYPRAGIFKFYVDGAAKGKLGWVGIGVAVCNDKGEILCMFSKGVGVRDSKEVEVLANLEAFRICSFFSGWYNHGK